MSITEFQNEVAFRTLADRLADLGGVSPERVILAPHAGPATEEDVVGLCNAAGKRLCELIDGILVEKAMGIPESIVTGLLFYELLGFVKAHNLGFVIGSDGLIRLFPGRIRLPDIAVVLWDRIPGDTMPSEQVLPFAPHFAVEVLSPSNTVKEMELKREDYFAAGVTIVWEVSLPEQAVRVYRGVHEFTLFGVDDTLTGEPILPGFAMPVKSLFEKRRRP